MRRALLVLLLLPALLLPISCNDDGLTISRDREVDGLYRLRSEMSDPSSGLECTADGTVRLFRAGTRVRGTYELTEECQGPGEVVEETMTGAVGHWAHRDPELSFQAGGCAFEGSVVGSPPNGAAGSVQCSATDTRTVPLEGEWAMTFGVVGIIVRPDTVVVPLDDNFVLSPTFEDVSGEEVRGWTVIWESLDPSVATVDESGIVLGISSGVTAVHGVTVPRYPLEEPVETVVPVRVGRKFVSVVAGSEHACAVLSNGRAYCWGRGAEGQLGQGEAVERQSSPVPVETFWSDLRFSSVSAGYLHTCGIALSGDAFCWGSNEHGALGDGSRQSSAVPTSVSQARTGGPFMDIAAGSHTTCGATATGVFCWGSDTCGQLGCGTIGAPDQLFPAFVLNGWGDYETWYGRYELSLSRSPSSEAGHVCAIVTQPNEPFAMSAEGTSKHTVYCWGRGSSGELGNGLSMDSGEPQQMESWFVLAGTISAGAEHTCKLVGGSADCWGDGSTGALGTGSIEPAVQSEPLPVAGELEFRSISAGDHFTCAVDSESGDAYCWGSGASHQLGNGAAVDRLEPTLVAGGVRFVSVSAGSRYACGVSGDGEVYCWGANDFGQLGTGDFETRETPTRVVFE